MCKCTLFHLAAWWDDIAWQQESSVYANRCLHEVPCFDKRFFYLVSFLPFLECPVSLKTGARML